jgi:hypothetical protein
VSLQKYATKHEVKKKAFLHKLMNIAKCRKTNFGNTKNKGSNKGYKKYLIEKVTP